MQLGYVARKRSALSDHPRFAASVATWIGGALGATLIAAVLGTASAGSLAAQSTAPTQNYWVYVGAESADLMHRVRFGPEGTVVEKTIPIGELAAEMEGPHGLVISPDGKYLHLTTGHGFPTGKYWRYELGPDTLLGPGQQLGNFPATIDVTPDGLYTFSANFNLHGDMVPSTISVVYTPTQTEIARVITCVMPHGSRISPDGLFQYSGCMMDDQLVEIDTRTFEVSRRFSVATGKEGPIAVSTTMAGMADMQHAGHDMGSMGSAPSAAAPLKAPLDPAEVGGSGMVHDMAPNSCSPTWAQPSVDGKSVFVACNKADHILEISRTDWKVTRTMPTGRGVYNLALTPDGKLLVATLKQGAGIEIFDLRTGKSVAQLKSSNVVAHGVVVSSDSRYAFVTSEGVGSDAGKLDVVDLQARRLVGTADVGQQASGIAFWKMGNPTAP